MINDQSKDSDNGAFDINDNVAQTDQNELEVIVISEARNGKKWMK